MSNTRRHPFEQKNARRCMVIVGMMGLMFVGLWSFARVSWASKAKAEQVGHIERPEATPANGFDQPKGLYIQEWNPDTTPWQPDWNTWAAGAHTRVWWTKVNTSTGQSTFLDTWLSKIPVGKKAIIGFYPKNNVTDCYFGLPDTFYNDASYTPLTLKDNNNQNVIRHCDGVKNTAVDFLNTKFQNELNSLLHNFVNYYTNTSVYREKIAGFEFASGANLEATPWVHPDSGTKVDPGYEHERQYEKSTYDFHYRPKGDDWALFNLWFAAQVEDALEDANSNKIAYVNFMQYWPDTTSWHDAVLCIGGVATGLCAPGSGYSPLTTGRIGLKQSALAADTVVGGSADRTCSWYKVDLERFEGDIWKVMSWAAYGRNLSTAWEFNNSFATGRLSQVYNEPAHIKYSLAMGLSYGADVMLIYPDNTEHTQILEWASRYVGKRVDSSLDQPVWIMLREAIEDTKEESVPTTISQISDQISDLEDYTDVGDGMSCTRLVGTPIPTPVHDCFCGHDVQATLGITDSINGAANTSWGKVGLDTTLYGATARRADNGALLKFNVDDAYMEDAEGANISVIYKKVGSNLRLLYKKQNTSGMTPLTANSLLDLGQGWWQATFIAAEPDFSNPGNSYDMAVDSISSGSGEWDWIGFVSVARQDTPATSTPPPPPTSTPTATPEPGPSFRERMETAPPGGFSSWYVANGASLSRVNDPRLEGSYAWKCEEGSQMQNWPECSATHLFGGAKEHVIVEYAVNIDAATQLGTFLWGGAFGGFVWPYFDLSHQLHLYCSSDMCGQLVDIIPGQSLQPSSWYRIRIEAIRNLSGPDTVRVAAYEGGNVSAAAASWVYENTNLNLLSSFTKVNMSTLFGVNNNWDERAYWDDFKVWYNQTPPILDGAKPMPEGVLPLSKTLRVGELGYEGGQDTYIVTTNWETPTPHGTHPNLYIRTNNTDGEVMSTLIGFDEISLPPIDVVYQALLSVYFLGQSVNSGTTEVHVAGLKPDWDASTATWLRPKTGAVWQAAGAKGANDRTAPVDSSLVNYTEVGTWLEFDVTELVQAGTTSFILYGEHQGVNKAIYFPSNDYWDVYKRPLLTIRYD